MTVLGIVGFGVIEPLSESEIGYSRLSVPCKPKTQRCVQFNMPWETEQKGGGNHHHVDSDWKSNIERTYTPLKSSSVPHWTDRLLLLMSKLPLNEGHFFNQLIELSG
jgi:hypothetical protein